MFHILYLKERLLLVAELKSIWAQTKDEAEEEEEEDEDDDIHKLQALLSFDVSSPKLLIKGEITSSDAGLLTEVIFVIYELISKQMNSFKRNFNLMHFSLFSLNLNPTNYK